VIAAVRGLWLLAALEGIASRAAELPNPAPTPLTHIGDVVKLTPAEAAKALPVRLDAVVLYYQPHEENLFVQDATGAIYVHSMKVFDIHAGSRVVINGTTNASYRNIVDGPDVRSIGEAPFPAPKSASFSDLINGALDCYFVKVTGTVQSSIIEGRDGTPFLALEMVVDGGRVRVQVLHFEGFDPNTFLDAEVSFSGAAGKIFDAKLEPVGVKLYVDNASSIQILSRSRISPFSLPITPIDQADQNYSPNIDGRRIRVRGTVILYHPGEMVVLDQQGKTLLVHTHQDDPLTIGQTVDAIGFSDYSDYAPGLSFAQFIPASNTEIVASQPMSYDEVMTGKHSFNLVSLTGVLVDEVNAAKQDTLVIRSGEHVFSAVLGSRQHLPPFKLGSTLRVTGVCVIDASGPYNSPVDFTLQMRSAADVAILILPSWITVRKLSLIAALLVTLVVVALIWAEMLRHRVAIQTEVIRRAAEEDAAWERRTVYIEKERSGVLEAINSTQPLEAVLALIAAFISKQIQGMTCSFRLLPTSVGDRGTGLRPEKASGEGPSTGPAAADSPSTGEVTELAPAAPGRCATKRSIRNREGKVTAEMVLLTEGKWRSNAHTEEVLDIGSRLAALAIENRLLHEQLVRRSEYDQLTDVPNRFLIEERLNSALAEARLSAGHVAVIYVDLDDFKQVNDRYGHRVGDLYLRQTAQRLSAQLRNRDLLARIGGDEFLAVIHDISGREEVEGVSRRLAACFLHPFTVEDIKIHGTASIGVAVFPEDGLDSEQLKRVADHAMYALKRQSKVTSISAAS
jgi:diguanylate cyclase (GGDEF)-like protein